jgi:hypothetical protein
MNPVGKHGVHHLGGNVLSIISKPLRDHPRLQFRFVTNPTPAMRAKARRMAERAKDRAIEAGCCDCAPWEGCNHRDFREVHRWWRRGWKLDHATHDELMQVFSAPMDQDVWPVVDRFAVAKDGSSYADVAYSICLQGQTAGFRRPG